MILYTIHRIHIIIIYQFTITDWGSAAVKSLFQYNVNISTQYKIICGINVYYVYCYYNKGNEIFFLN